MRCGESTKKAQPTITLLDPPHDHKKFRQVFRFENLPVKDGVGNRVSMVSGPRRVLQDLAAGALLLHVFVGNLSRKDILSEIFVGSQRGHGADAKGRLAGKGLDSNRCGKHGIIGLYRTVISQSDFCSAFCCRRFNVWTKMSEGPKKIQFSHCVFLFHRFCEAYDRGQKFPSARRPLILLVPSDWPI